jgi:hypothetical protein
MNVKKIIFIENRQKTIFWEEIASYLFKQNIEIYWIVQNHNFTPKIGSVYQIPYPMSCDMIKNSKNELFRYTASTDRLVNYFKGGVDHYNYYYDCILANIDHIDPDVIIGEATLFHEIIISKIAEQKKILHLNPCGIAYPPGRFSFFLWDSSQTAGLSNETLKESECNELINMISTSAIIPSYIICNKQAENKLDAMANSLSYKFKTLKPYLFGERYNTPSPIKKILKDIYTKKTLKKWDKLSNERGNFADNKKTILYPLQLQPEANLDVHGNLFRNQVLIIKEISSALPENWHLLVKTNPKSKYEMNSQLLDLVKESDNIAPLKSTTKMSDIFSNVDIVITVTGTIAQECFFSDKPVGVFGPSIVDNFLKDSKLYRYEDIKSLILKVEEKNYQFSTKNEKIELIKLLANTSYTGLISDPISDPDCISQENIEMVSKHFLNLFESLENK